MAAVKNQKGKNSWHEESQTLTGDHITGFVNRGVAMATIAKCKKETAICTYTQAKCVTMK